MQIHFKQPIKLNCTEISISYLKNIHTEKDNTNYMLNITSWGDTGILIFYQKRMNKATIEDQGPVITRYIFKDMIPPLIPKCT